MNLLKIFLVGVAGAVAWLAGLLLFFGPAQVVLTDPDLQSAKFLSVMGIMEPLPRVAVRPWVLPLGILVIAIIHATVFSRLRLSGSRLRRGSVFGLIAWALMAPWFEFYLPWNAMHEPFPLVLLELVLWALVLQLVGIVIAFAQGLVFRERT